MAMSVAPVSALCLLFLLSVCTACYISNCPIGGKRSALDFPSRKCMSCGPGNRGRCFGPSICCGEGMGCYVGSPEAASCVEENYLPSPCEAGGRVCGSEERRCAAPGICCDVEGCSIDQSCFEDEAAEYISQSESSSHDHDLLMKLLHMISHTPPHRVHQ
ncbi:oxytocin-neurophysin 1 [Salmo salar]|uniref:Oxytocin-neurophysin 1 n=1 Tax=Salmo salar TaxID=8030 RepID=A0A1S3LBT7_SALSA|nr:oxytocin-neurophysin 1 [Salmo salar]|eukprot:XP_013988427.1 PREDICTED: isotocin-neurophysin IT 1-like isoform X1 [Salmo salar]